MILAAGRCLMAMLALNLELLQPFDLGSPPTRVLLLIQFTVAISSFAHSLLPECQQNCTEINIPYPFQITPGCGLPAFTLNCTSGASPSLFIASTAIQILDISSTALIVDATTLVASSCASPSTTTHHPHLSLGHSSPFVFSSNNLFLTTGCNVSGSFSTDVPAAITTCQTNCSADQSTTSPFCDLPGCCSLALPTGSRSLSLEAQSLATNSTDCGYARALYPSFSRTPADLKPVKNGSFGVQLLWAIPSRSCEAAITAEGYACSSNASCVSVPEAPGYICDCSRHGYEGDGYVNGSGCFDIDECAELTSNQCSAAADCINTLGSYSCRCLESFYGDGYVNGTGCVSRKGIFSEAILIGCLSAVAVMTSIIAFVFWRFKVKPLGSK